MFMLGSKPSDNVISTPPSLIFSSIVWFFLRSIFHHDCNYAKMCDRQLTSSLCTHVTQYVHQSTSIENLRIFIAHDAHHRHHQLASQDRHREVDLKLLPFTNAIFLKAEHELRLNFSSPRLDQGARKGREENGLSEAI
jgi:hypothetical protein